jgi:mannose-6-phosphate isomerase-like protein (cupin superfamily)
VRPMPLMSDEELAKRPELTTAEVLPNHVARYLDMVAYADKRPCKVIGEHGLLRDKPGFEVDLITRGSSTDRKHKHNRPSVLMPVKGHWRVDWEGGSTTLAPGDTMSVPEHVMHSAVPSMTGDAALYHIIATDDPAGLTWKG